MGQILSFAKPAIGPRIFKGAYAAGAIAFVFFAGGVAFCYFAVMPAAFSWAAALVQGTRTAIHPQMSSYVSFTLMILVAFGIAFELPIFLALAVRIGATTPAKLARARSYAYVAAFVVGAVLTPPDVISQTALALPLIILYEAGIFFGKIISPKKTAVGKTV